MKLSDFAVERPGSIACNTLGNEVISIAHMTNGQYEIVTIDMAPQGRERRVGIFDRHHTEIWLAHKSAKHCRMYGAAS